MKVDAVPGRTTHLSLTPTETGEFQTDPKLRVQCAELCGLAHARMRIPVRVVSEGAFEAWVAQQESETPSPGTAPAAGATPVEVRLTEFEIDLSATTLPAGPITFNVTNEGTVVHNLRVIATDLPPDRLPVDEATFSVDESRVEVVARSPDWNAGESGVLSTELEPGSYVLVCAIPAHYQSGMVAGITVEGP